jgi:hypothetical protein
MKANELRIGNYLFDREDRLCKVEAIDLAFIDSVVNEAFKAPAIIGGLTALPHKPIELTEEILLKCEIDEDINLEFDKILGYYVVYLEDSFCLNSVKLYHLHQLQNLYHALTNEELEINL